MEQVKTREWLVLANFPQSLHQLRSNWYLGTNAILLRNLEDDESSPAHVHTQIFQAILPLAALSSPDHQLVRLSMIRHSTCISTRRFFCVFQFDFV